MQAPNQARYALKVEHRGELYQFADGRGRLPPKVREQADLFFAANPHHTDKSKLAFLNLVIAGEVEGFTRVNPRVQLPIFEQNKRYKIILIIEGLAHNLFWSESKYYADKNTLEKLKRLSPDTSLPVFLFEIECEIHPNVRLSGFENLSIAKIKLLKDTESILLYPSQ